MYKIKFLVHRKSEDDDILLEAKAPVTKTVAYSDSDIEQASCHWKSMGLRRIMEITAFKGAKLTEAEIVEMFYSPSGKVLGKEFHKDIGPADLKVKAQLVKKYGEVKGKKVDNQSNTDPIDPDDAPAPKADWEGDPEKEKAFRKEVLYVKLKENEISFSHNTGTQKLIDKLKDNGIEV